MLTTRELFIRRRNRTRYQIKNRAKQDLPRLSVFRSNKHIYAQIIAIKEGGKILAYASSNEKQFDSKGKGLEKAESVGKIIAERAKKAGIEKIIFDRGGFMYHGRVKALADSARTSGLKF